MPASSSKRSSHPTAFLTFDQRKCKACWCCVEACPKHVLGKVSVLWHKHAVVRRGDDCTGCFKCVTVCKAGALQHRSVAA